jgi:hypothetical protein
MMRMPPVLTLGAFLLLGGCDETANKSAVPSPPAPPPPLPLVAITDVPPPANPTVILKPGANLGIVAQDTYGHESFSGFLSVINNVTDPTKLRDGLELKTLAIRVAFQEAGVDPIYQPAINALAKAATDYFAQTEAFRGALSATTESGKPELSNGVTTVFVSCADAIDAAVAVLEASKPPHTVPKKSIESSAKHPPTCENSRKETSPRMTTLRI